MSNDGPIIFALVIGCICIPTGISFVGLSSDFTEIGGLNFARLGGIGLLILGMCSLILGALFVFGNRSR